MQILVIGGGAAGFFGGIEAAKFGLDITVLEGGRSVLDKVRISGGGRCNVTHACFDPKLLVQHYPRGGQELRGPLSRFQPRDTIAWFEAQGVRLKTEADGRMFPTTDDSGTIVNCLTHAAAERGVAVRTNSRVVGVRKSAGLFECTLKSGATYFSEKLLLATGGSRAGFELAANLGHTIVPPVPSLFTLEIQDDRIRDLAGVAVQDVQLRLTTADGMLEQRGPLLITHWGVSGPAVLRLSAWGARMLHQAGYRAKLTVNWVASMTNEEISARLRSTKASSGKRGVETTCPFDLPRRLWQSLTRAVLREDMRWADVSKSHLQMLRDQLVRGEFQVNGKGVFKEEFVTAGGIYLKDVNFKTMESKTCAGLYFAGEILDVDGVTGGFNFQNAWTTGWIAGQSIANVADAKVATRSTDDL